jgi:hypothetical protein
MKGDIFMSEGKKHQYIKNQIAQALADDSRVTKLMLERDLDTVRPDISFYLDDKPCAIEIQYSKESWKQVVERTNRSFRLGIYILWVLCYDKPFVEGKPYRVPTWQLCLHAMYYGAVYLWIRGQTVLPTHLRHYENLDAWYRKKQSDGTWISPLYKSKRIPWFLDDVLITDLQPMTREAGNYGKYTLPNAHILSVSYEKLEQAREATHSFFDDRRVLRHNDKDDNGEYLFC